MGVFDVAGAHAPKRHRKPRVRIEQRQVAQRLDVGLAHEPPADHADAYGLHARASVPPPAAGGFGFMIA